MTPDLVKLRQRAIDGMVSYMKFGGAEDEDDPEYDPDFDAGYSQEHIDQCGKIIDEFFAALSAVPDKNRGDAIREVVKSAVVKLNKLNDKCEGSLIETDQREDLCALLLSAAEVAGLDCAKSEDITEEWREW